MTGTKTLPAQWERFLKTVSDRLSKPSPELPSVRCLTKTTLSSLFSDIQKELELPSTFPSGTEIMQLLSSMGLASAIATENDKGNTPSKEFYLIGISNSHDPVADPFEMLQAYRHEGVICFFSALSFYEMTTQFPSHHHIATIIEPTPTSKTEEARKNNSPTLTSDGKESGTKKLGTLAFSCQGIPFYTAKRSRSTIPGIQSRNYNSRTIIRIASREQTLLDTLHYPIHCGGPEVVFEAWENQMGTLDEIALLELMKTINSQQLTRRIGSLFDYCSYKPKWELSQFLEISKNEVQSSSLLANIPLLRGFHYSHFNADWKTLTP